MHSKSPPPSPRSSCWHTARRVEGMLGRSSCAKLAPRHQACILQPLQNTAFRAPAPTLYPCRSILPAPILLHLHWARGSSFPDTACGAKHHSGKQGGVRTHLGKDRNTSSSPSRKCPVAGCLAHIETQNLTFRTTQMPSGRSSSQGPDVAASWRSSDQSVEIQWITYCTCNMS